MGENSKIEWTDATWNPVRARNIVTGRIGWHCEHESEGCRFCYADGMNHRLGTGLPFKPGHRKDVEIFLDEKTLLAPLRWKRPRDIFVNSMTDSFASFVKDGWLDRIFAVMALTPRHRYQVLTKRAARMRDYCSKIESESVEATIKRFAAAMPPSPWPDFKEMVFPLKNVWLGVSAEDQATADERIPLLIDTPAAVRFLSLEPLLGPIDLSSYLSWRPLGKILWTIVGGESGPKARPVRIEWVRSLRDQCQAAQVSYFFKQWGGRNKKAAGRLLDGVEWNQMPART